MPLSIAMDSPGRCQLDYLRLSVTDWCRERRLHCRPMTAISAGEVCRAGPESTTDRHSLGTLHPRSVGAITDRSLNRSHEPV